MRSAFNVGELRKLLADENIPDDLPILASSYDHSYVRVVLEVYTARYVEDENYYCEDAGDDSAHRPEEIVIKALIVN